MKRFIEGKDRRQTQQVSLTDPDARAMTMSTDSRGIMGYNVQPPSIHSTI
jgi:nitrate reductase cytochrome c-type subunit